MNTLPLDVVRCTGKNEQYSCPDAVLCSRCHAHRYWDHQCGVNPKLITVINAEVDCEYRKEIEE